MHLIMGLGKLIQEFVHGRRVFELQIVRRERLQKSYKNLFRIKS